jgi:hypothetical protein
VTGVAASWLARPPDPDQALRPIERELADRREVVLIEP